MHTTQPIKLQLPKPRNKQLHDALSGRHGGRMKSPKDRNRQQEKQHLRHQLQDIA